MWTRRRGEAGTAQGQEPELEFDLGLVWFELDNQGELKRSQPEHDEEALIS